MKVEVIQYEVKTVVSKKDATKGQEFKIPEAQCIVHGDDGKKVVGVLNLPRDHPPVKPGMYVPTFRIGVMFDGGKLYGQIEALVPASKPG